MTVRCVCVTGGVHVHSVGLPGAPLHRGEATVHGWGLAPLCQGGPTTGLCQQGLSTRAAQDSDQERGCVLWLCQAAGLAAPPTTPTPARWDPATVPLRGFTLSFR